MQITDLLSRLGYIEYWDKPIAGLDIGMHWSSELSVSINKGRESQNKTMLNPVLKDLSKSNIVGWLDTQEMIRLKDCRTYRNQLGVLNVLIVKGFMIIISNKPSSCCDTCILDNKEVKK